MVGKTDDDMGLLILSIVGAAVVGEVGGRSLFEFGELS